MRTFRVNFIKIEKDIDNKTGKEVGRKETSLGSVVLDDYGVSQQTYSLIAKAFRHAGESCQLADKVLVTQL